MIDTLAGPRRRLVDAAGARRLRRRAISSDGRIRRTATQALGDEHAARLGAAALAAAAAQCGQCAAAARAGAAAAAAALARRCVWIDLIDRLN